MLLLGLLAACAAPPQPLDARSAARLAEATPGTDMLGERMYVGDTHHLDGHQVYRYARFVEDAVDGTVASHVTWDLEGLPVVLQQAAYDDAGRVRWFEEVHGQSGWVGTVHVGEDAVTFEATLGAQTVTRTEDLAEPLHAGPSLFGFALAHWDALVDGEVVPLRFPVVAQQRTYLLDLSLERSDAEETGFRLEARSALVRLALAPMHLTFETQTRTPRSYDGRVPPMRDAAGRWAPLDAHVIYRDVSSSYR
jgi:hypothetical protein